MPLEIHHLPVISTQHLTEDVAKQLADAKPQSWPPCATWPNGFFIFLDDLESHDGPVAQCLVDIRNWLRGIEDSGAINNARWVRLDGDADPVEGLPVYDW